MDNQPVTSPQPVYNPPTQINNSGAPKGSSSIPWLILIIILILAIAGVYVWQHKKVSNLEAQLSSANAKSESSSNTATTQNTDYLYMYTYGLRIPLSSSIKDLYYLDDNTNSASSGDVLSFSTQTITNDDAACTAEPGTTNEFFSQAVSDTSPNPTQTPVNGSPFGLVIITKTAVPISQVGSLDQDVGISIAHKNGYYIYYKAPQAACSSSTSTQNLTLQQKQTFLTDLQKIQVI